jgi:hypothetical protein
MFFGKPIIVCFPRNTGGKFLMNCLGLSNDVLLSDIELVKKQLENKLNLNDKLDLLLKRLEHVKQGKLEWNDLNLGFGHLFNCNNELNNCSDYEKKKFSQYTYNISLPNDIFLSSNVKDIIINSNKFFIVETHGMNNAILWYNNWDDSKLIVFNNNYNKFYNYRIDPHCIENFIWDIKQFQSIPFLEWSADDYLIEDLFLNKVKYIYDSIGLTDFNSDAILIYRSAWLETIKR